MNKMKKMNKMNKTNKMNISSILVTLLFIFSGSIWAQKADLVVNVKGFNSNKGTAIIYVFNAKKGFPSDESKAIKVINCKITDSKCATTIKGLNYGTYAISVLHDENANNKLDTNFLGMPKEGTGVSNNPDNDGPPSYNDAKFMLVENNKVNIIIMKYL